MKIAAIDIGSNSIHLIIAELYPDGHYVVVDKAKDMVGLASGTVSSGFLSDEAMARGLDSLKRFADMSRSRGVQDIIAVATSAVREAVNGEHFVKLVREECGIDVKVIEGKEEARLIYLGARDHIDWGERKGLLVDIGGGSVEFVVGDQNEATCFASLPLGVRRLSERFLHSDPPKKAELKQLKEFILQELTCLPDILKDHSFDFVIGSSGTLKNLAMMAARRNGDEISESHGAWTRQQDLKEMARALSGLNKSERITYHGLNAKRTDTIVAGAQLIKYILRIVNHDCYVACDYALRDGLLVDYMENNLSEKAPDASRRMRRRSVRRLFYKFNTRGTQHPHDVARLTMELFDQLQDLHGLSSRDRERLRHAAFLYDVGSSINKEDRHLHSAYLIKYGQLPGFTEKDRAWMAFLVRLRRRPELCEDADFLALSQASQRRLLSSAAILRLGAALDRSSSGNVTKVRCVLKDG